MAYLDFAGDFPLPSRIGAMPAVAPVAGLSSLEYAVIGLAQHDSVRSLSQPSRWSRAVDGLLGRGTTAPLADPRLEALRRLAVHARHRNFALPPAEIRNFRSAGFEEAQIETVVDAVARLRATNLSAAV